MPIADLIDVLGRIPTLYSASLFRIASHLSPPSSTNVTWRENKRPGWILMAHLSYHYMMNATVSPIHLVFETKSSKLLHIVMRRWRDNFIAVNMDFDKVYRWPCTQYQLKSAKVINRPKSKVWQSTTSLLNIRILTSYWQFLIEFGVK